MSTRATELTIGHYPEKPHQNQFRKVHVSIWAYWESETEVVQDSLVWLSDTIINKQPMYSYSLKTMIKEVLYNIEKRS